MRIIDITRELTAAPVYPGDPPPVLTALRRMDRGDGYNLSALSMSLHSGTHIDAPRHFLVDGITVDEIPLDSCCGECVVIDYDGVLLGDEAERMTARGLGERVLFKGKMEIDTSAAFVLSRAGIRLIGAEGQSVAGFQQTAAVHRQLLGAGVLLLEGLDLSAAAPGRYRLIALPIRVAGADGAPVRAVLLDDQPLEIEHAFLRG